MQDNTFLAVLIIVVGCFALGAFIEFKLMPVLKRTHAEWQAKLKNRRHTKAVIWLHDIEKSRLPALTDKRR